MVVLICRPPGVQILAARGQFELVRGRVLVDARLADEDRFAETCHGDLGRATAGQQQAYPRRDGLGCDRREKNDRHMPRKRRATTTQAKQKKPGLPIPYLKTRNTMSETEGRAEAARLRVATPWENHPRSP